MSVSRQGLRHGLWLKTMLSVRTADQMGVTTTEYYRFERYDPEEAANAKASEEYVTRTEWNKLIESLGGILEE